MGIYGYLFILSLFLTYITGPALIITGQLATHILKAIEKPHGQRWQYFCDKFPTGVVAPCLWTWAASVEVVMERVGVPLNY